MLVPESAGLTDVGAKRKNNQDAFLVDDALGLYVVADGMGGHRAGEVASAIVVKTLKDYLKRFQSEGVVEEMADADESLSREANRLHAAIRLANGSVNALSRENPEYRGMGSTVAAVMFTDETIIAANVGDSPIYLVRGGVVADISTPHTVLAETGGYGPGKIGLEPSLYSHMLTRAVGVDADVGVDLTENQRFDGDMLILCSDGLSNLVSPEEVLAKAALAPAVCCRELVDLALRRGGDDNITVVAVRSKRRCGVFSLVRRFLKRFLPGSGGLYRP